VEKKCSTYVTILPMYLVDDHWQCSSFSLNVLFLFSLKSFLLSILYHPTNIIVKKKQFCLSSQNSLIILLMLFLWLSDEGGRTVEYFLSTDQTCTHEHGTRTSLTRTHAHKYFVTYHQCNSYYQCPLSNLHSGSRVRSIIIVIIIMIVKVYSLYSVVR